MHYGNIIKVVGLATLAMGFATSAHAQNSPYQFYQEETAVAWQSESLYWTFDVDFTKTSANPLYNFTTFTNPRTGGTVNSYPLKIVSLGGCYEIRTTGATGSDVLLSVQNYNNVWTWLADDNGGNGQFFARVYIKPPAQYDLRISEYTNGNANDQITVIMRKVKANPGSTINSSSCRLLNQPYWQMDLNSGNPYNPQ